MSSIFGGVSSGGGGGGGVLTLTGNSGGPVGPTGGNIDVLGLNVITVDGTPGTSTLEVQLTPATDGQLIIGATGMDPAWANLISSDASVTITNGPNSIDLTVGGATFGVTTLSGDTGVATPVMGDILIAGGDNITTAAAGSTVTVSLNDFISWPATAQTQDAGLIEIDGDVALHYYGENNTFVGANSGNFTLTVLQASNNTSVGALSMAGLTTGDGNSALGNGALNFCSVGVGNTAAGRLSLASLTSGISNCALGSACLGSLDTGSNNIGIGLAAGSNYTTSESDNIIIGNSGTITDNNVIRIGTSGTGVGQQNDCYVAGIFGRPFGATSRVVQVDNTGKVGSSTGTNGQILISGGGGPVWANITSTGGSIGITNGAGTINLEAANAVDTFDSDAGSATPAAGVITFEGGELLNSSAAGSTVTFNLDRGNDGEIPISATGGATQYANITSTDGSIIVTNGPNSIDLSAASEAAGGAFLALQDFPVANVTGDGTLYFLGNSGGGGAALNVIFDDGNNFFPGNGLSIPAFYTAPVSGRYQFTFSVSIWNVSDTQPLGGNAFNASLGQLTISTPARTYDFACSPSAQGGYDNRTGGGVAFGMSQIVTLQYTVITELAAGDEALFGVMTNKGAGTPSLTIGVGDTSVTNPVNSASNTTYICGYLVDPI